MLKKKRNELVLIAVLILLAGCTDPFNIEPIKFQKEFNPIESVYSDAGFSPEDIEKIDSASLLTENECSTLTNKLKNAEGLIEKIKTRIDSLVNSREKHALSEALKVQYSRNAYYSALLDLKEEQRTEKIISLIESADTNSLLAGNCSEISLKEFEAFDYSLSWAEFSAVELDEQIDFFNQTYSEYSTAANFSEKKSKADLSVLFDLFNAGRILGEGCVAVSSAGTALEEIESAANQENLCLVINSLGEQTKKINSSAEKFDSLLGSSAVEKYLPDPDAAKEKAQNLLSISTEFTDFYEQLKKECE